MERPDTQMSFNIDKWFNKTKRIEQLEKYVSMTRSARFGFTAYNESEKAGRVNRHFDTIATRYDLMNTLLSGGIHYAWKRKTVSLLNIKTGDRILDVCAGTGDISRLSALTASKEGVNIAYDINWRMIRQGKKKNLENVAFVQGDAECLAFPDETFDAVSIGFGIRNITHLETGFKEIFRVLKKGGTMCCLEFSRPDNRLFRFLYDVYSFWIMPFAGQVITGSREAYTAFPESIRAFPLPDELAGILKTIGFNDIKITKLTNGICVIHTARK